MEKPPNKNYVGIKSLDVIRWGKQSNKQRFKCKNCGLLFTDNRSEQI